MKKAKAFGSILFWITLISPVFSFSLASIVGETSIFGVAGIIRYSWIMWLFAPLGILSLLIGKKLQQSKQKYKKNYIIACICLPLLIVFGSYRFVFSNVSYDTNKVTIIEEITKLELPKQAKIATTEFESYNLSYLKIIEEKDKTSFERELETSILWRKELSNKIKSLLPHDVQFELENFDYFVFYNVTDNKYNIYPPDGEYECIFVAYDREIQRLLILDGYSIDLN